MDPGIEPETPEFKNPQAGYPDAVTPERCVTTIGETRASASYETPAAMDDGIAASGCNITLLSVNGRI